MKMNEAYIAGDIMSRGSQLARREECDKIDKANLAINYYSPALNKSINDKSNMTEEQNNHLAEKIVQADLERLWNSDIVVACPEQNAIGTMCETGILYGWKYMADKLMKSIIETTKKDISQLSTQEKAACYDILLREITKIDDKQNYFHYSDIRTNHLNEKDWRRSFSINQFLYGIILGCAEDKMLHNSFDEIIPILKEKYGTKD